jgi:nitroreductase
MVPDDRQAALNGESAPMSCNDVAWLQRRRSVAVKRLGPPAPTADELRAILGAALAAPDHGALRPWRLVLCAPGSRERLAELFVAAKRARHPDSTAIELEREREKARRPPVLLALVAAPKTGHEKVPEIEQIATAGAALQSILLAAHGLGYGAITLSGSRCAADNVRSALGVGAAETLLGFISIGTIVDTPRLASRPSLSDVLSVFDGS